MSRWLIAGTLFVSLVLIGGQPPFNNGQQEIFAVEMSSTEASLPVQGGVGHPTGNKDELHLLSRVVAAESEGEPFEGQVAVAAVLLNRVKSPSFPNTVAGVIYQPLAFESVLNGHIWRVSNLEAAERAALAALNGWDPTYGALFFWNPSKPVSPWIWTRRIVRTIGRHVFGL
ncbi:MAG: cell wall hydrolase [Bacillota bacterium]